MYSTPHCSIGHQVLPNQDFPMEAEDFPRSGKYPKDVPLLTYLDYLQSIKSIILDWDLKMSKS